MVGFNYTIVVLFTMFTVKSAMKENKIISILIILFYFIADLIVSRV